VCWRHEAEMKMPTPSKPAAHPNMRCPSLSHIKGPTVNRWGPAEGHPPILVCNRR
jgi:hypothetical protein